MKKLLLSLVMVLMTVMPTAAQMNEALHEGFDGGSLPAGWTQEYMRTPMTLGVDTVAFSWNVESGAGLSNPEGAISGEGRIAARNSSTDEMRFVTRLISPVINVSNGMFRPQLIFSHAEPAYAGYSDTLRVYYRTSATDMWHAYDRCVYTKNNNWKTETIDLIAPSNRYQLAFEITENMGHGVVLDEIIVRPTPTCRPVMDVHAINIHAFDATLVWNEEGYFDHFEVLVTKSPVEDFDAIPDSIVVHRDNEVYNTELRVEGLEAETFYYVYVRSDCPERANGFTDWSEGVFQSLSVIYLPYSQNFNSFDAFANTPLYGLTHGWMNGSTRNVQSPFVSNAGSKIDKASFSIDSTAYLCFDASLRAESSALPMGSFAYVVSPEVIVPSLQGLEVSFWATAYDKVTLGADKYASSLMVGVMSDPTDFLTFEVIDTVRIETSYLLKKFTIPFSNYTGEGKYVALVSRFDALNAFYVDNLTMSMPGVFVPTHVKATKAHSTGFTVSADFADADSWNLKVSTEYRRDGLVADSTVLFSQTGLTGSSYQVNVADQSLAGKIVKIYLQSMKNGVTSDWSFPVTLRIPTVMTVPYTNSCDQHSGLLNLSDLNNELRASVRQTMASVYYPVTSIGSIQNYPVVETVKPNYKGAHARMEGVDSWFALPELQDMSNLRMTFRYATVKDAKAKLEIGVMTDPYDLSTFERVTGFTVSLNEYRRALVDLDAYAGEGKFIAFRLLDAGVASLGSVLLLDEILIEEWGDCREAANVEATVSSNSAEIHWADGGMTEWIVGISTKRSMLNATYHTVTSPTFTFTDLEPETQYYYTIQTKCGDDLLDLDNVFYEFRTPRGLPFEEKFATTSLPKDWAMGTGKLSNVFNGTALASSTSGWTISTSHLFAPQSGYGAYANIYGTSCFKWLLSPVLEMPENVEALELSFDVALSGSTYSSSSTEPGPDDVFAVLFSLDGGNTWSRTNATVWSNDGQGDFVLSDLPWDASMHIDLNADACIGRSIRFAFYVESTVLNEDYYLSIDNISLHVSDPNCGGVSNLQATTNGLVTWTLGGVNPYPAVIQVSKNSAFGVLLSTDTVAGNRLQLNNLESSSRYYVRARQLCPIPQDWVTTSFATPCDAVTVEDFGTENFASPSVLDCWSVGFAYDNGSGTAPVRVNSERFGQVLSITKTTTDSTASDGAYAASPQFALPDTLSMKDYEVVFRAGTYGSDAKNVGRIKVGVTNNVSSATYAAFGFRSMAELRLSEATDSMGLKTYAVSLANYTGSGKYIMFYSEAGADSTNFVYIDDVSLERASNCAMVLSLESDTTTEESAHLVWSGDAASYEVMLTTSFCNPDTVTEPVFRGEVEGNELWIEELVPNTAYYAYIRSICDEEFSRWSSPTRLVTRFGIFFEPWDDKSTLAAAGWTQSSTQLKNSVLSNLTLGSSKYTLTTSMTNSTSTVTVTGMYDKIARANIYSTGQYAWLITPSIDLTTVESGAQLSFKLAVYPYGSSVVSESINKRFAVIVSEDNGATWNPANGIYWTCDGNGDYDFRALSANAQQVRMDLSQYVGKRIKLGFYGESTSIESDQTSTDLYFAMDSIGVSKYIAECLGVRNLQFELISGTEAKATWRQISIPALADLELATDANFENIVAEVSAVDTNSYTFGNLLPNMTYYVRVSQTGCTTKPLVAYINTPKSIPYEEKLNAMPMDWVVMKGNVEKAFHDTLPNIVTSSAWSIKNGHLFGELYRQATQSEYWIVTPDVVLTATEEDSLALSFDLNVTAHNKDTAYSNPAKTDGQELRVLISKDGGESWSEDNQWLFANTTDAYMQLSEIDTLTRIQLNLNDYKNERVRVAFYKASTHANNDNDVYISNFRMGEVVLPCDLPTDLMVDEIGFGEAHLSWQTEATTSVVQLSKSEAFAAVVSDTVNATEWQLQNLESATEYFVRVKALCSEKSISDWTTAISFKTSIGLPYLEPLMNRDNWSAYTEFSGEDALVSPTFTNKSKASAGWKASSSTQQVGVAHIVCQHDTATSWFVSPVIDLTPNRNDTAIVLSLDLAVTSTSTGKTKPSATNLAGKKLFIMVSTDNGVTWPVANRIEWSDAAGAMFKLTDVPGTGKHYENIPMTQYRGQKIRVALVLAGSVKKTFYVHAANFYMEAIGSTCFGVSDIAVNHVDTAALVSLTPKDEATHWQVAYGVFGTQLLDMPIVDSNNKDSVLLGGLQLNSTYEVYARSICSVGDTSAWFGPVQLQTPLGLTYEAPFRNSFNDWVRYTGALKDVTYTDSLTSVTNGWSTTSSTAVLGEAHIYAVKDASNVNWLVSPVINLMPQAGTTSNIYLSMDMALTASSTSTSAPTNVNGHTFTIAVSEDGGATWIKKNRIVFGDRMSKNVYANIPAGKGSAYHFDVTKYAGKEIRIALIMGAAATGSSALHINDLELALYDVPCFGVAALAATYEHGVAEVILTPGDTATVWQYTYGKHGFVPSDENVFTTRSKTFRILDLDHSSTYDIYARSLCGANDTSAWTGPAVVVTPIGVRYEEPLNGSSMPAQWGTYAYSTTTEKFAPSSSGYWAVGSVKNSYVWNANHAYINAYSTRKEMLATPLIDLGKVAGKAIALNFDMALTKYASNTAPTSVAGQTFEIRVSMDNGSTWGEPVAVWDETSTGDFSYSGIPTTGATYQIDMSEFGGESVRIGFFSVSTGGGCDNDLHIRNVVLDTLSGSFCAPISRVSVMEADFTTVKLSFRALGIYDALDIEYVCQPENELFNPNKALHTDTSVVVIKGLQPSMNYNVFARVLCQDSILTEWSGPFVVQTAECVPVTGISYVVADSLDVVDMTLTTASATALGYQVVIAERNGEIDERLIETSKTPHFVIAYPFAASSVYDVYARKICVEGDTADWSGPFALKTPVSLNGEVIYAENLNKTSAPENWEGYNTSSTIIPTPETAFTSTSSSWTVGSGRNSYVWGVNHAYVNTYSTNKRMLATQTIDLSGISSTGAVLVFDLALTDYNNGNAPESVAGQRFEIRVTKDGGLSWDLVEAWAENGAEHVYGEIPVSGETYQVNISEYVGYEIQIGFYAVSVTSGGPDNDLHLRNVYVLGAGGSGSTCRRPDPFTFVNSTLTTALLTLTDSVNGYYELATDSRFENVVAADSIHSTQLQLTNLLPSTTYYIHLKRFCNDDSESKYSNATNFSTAFGVRFFEGFDDASVVGTLWKKRSALISNVFARGASAFTTESATYGPWNHTTDVRQMGTPHVRSNLYTSSCHEWLISPEIDLTPNVGQSLLMAFDVATSTYGNGMSEAAVSPDDRFVVAISTDNGNTWSAQNAYSWDSPNSVAVRNMNKQGDFNTSFTAAPQRKILDLSKFAGQHIVIGFYSESTAEGTDTYLYLDNIELNATISVSYNDSICSSAEYENHGFAFAENTLSPGDTVFSRYSELMDSVVYLNLHISESFTIEFADTICEGEVYNEHGYNFVASTSTIMRRRLEASNGCDSLVLLDLVVLPTQRIDQEISACLGSSYEHNGKTYYSNAIIRDTLESMNGCDSIMTYYLTFSEQMHYDIKEDVALCAGDTLWVGDIYPFYKAGTYTVNLSSINGCDSVVTIHLVELDAKGYLYDSVLVENLPYSFGSIEVPAGTPAGEYEYTVSTSCGTNGTLVLTVVDKSEGFDGIFSGKHKVYKRVVDDQLFIIVDDRWYDATGRAVKVE